MARRLSTIASSLPESYRFPMSTPAESATDTPSGSWDRIRDARVLQLLGVYAGGSFAVLQGGDIFVHRLGLPDWTFFGLVLVLLAGIPVVLATALVQSGDGARLRGVFTWRNTALWGVGSLTALVLAVGLFMGARHLGIGPVGSLVAQGVIDREETILIADFGSPMGDELLAGAVTEAFRVDLEQSPMVRILSPSGIRDGLLRMERGDDFSLPAPVARELAVREGIRAVLVGEVNTTGGGAILTARLIDPVTEESLISVRETAADSSGVIPAVDRLSARMRERMGESLRTIRGGEPLERATTASLTALRRYSQGVRAIDMERDFVPGIELLREAIAEDSTFAMAWRKLGVTLMNQNYPQGEWQEALTRAYELSDKLTERERLLARGSYYGSVENDATRAIAAYRALLEVDPYNSTALNNLAVQYGVQGDPESAVEMYRRAIRADSLGVVYHSNLISSLVDLGQWEEADEARRHFATTHPNLGLPKILEPLLLGARHDFDAAEAVARRLVDDPQITGVDRMQILGGMVNLSLIRGRTAEALRWMDALMRQRAELGYGVGEDDATDEFYAAQVALMLVGDTAGAVGAVDALLEGDAFTQEIWELAAMEGAQIQLARFFLQAGQVQRAQAMFQEWNTLVTGPIPSWLEDQRDDLEALLWLEAGRTEDALRHFEAQTRAPNAGAQSHFVLGSAHFRLGNHARARDALLAYLDHPQLYRLEPDGWTYPRALWKLAEAEETLGNPEAAARWYDAFAELWAEADPELQPRVEEARRRSQAL